MYGYEAEWIWNALVVALRGDIAGYSDIVGAGRAGRVGDGGDGAGGAERAIERALKSAAIYTGETESFVG